MRAWLPFFAMAAATGAGFASMPAHADGQLSAERLDVLDQQGYFTPGFKQAVHDLVDTRHELDAATSEKAQLTKDLPGLQKQAAEAGAQVVALRQELAKYDHPEDNDFAALQSKVNDATAKPAEEIALAQAYVWTYPSSPHEGEAQQYLQKIQTKVAEEQKAEQDAEAARLAAHAKLVQRAQAKDLSLSEWRDLLRDMSQDDLVKLMGHPTSEVGDYWIYSGDWVTNAATHQKAGLQINFNGGRVLTVDEKPSPP